MVRLVERREIDKCVEVIREILFSHALMTAAGRAVKK